VRLSEHYSSEYVLSACSYPSLHVRLSEHYSSEYVLSACSSHSEADMNMPPTQIPMSNVQAAAYLPTIMTQQDQVATDLNTFD
jgi:hypothetical protein